ncbi:10637_t:CDS:2, partial [Dentiscutata erythropus]
NKGLATPTEAPTHPLFTYNHLFKKKPSLQLSNSDRLLFQPSSSYSFPNLYTPSPFYNLLQMVSTFTLSYSDLEPTSYTTRQFLPTISEFLKSIDENENTVDYYQELSNEELKECG